MNTLLLYMLKAAICIAMLYMIYNLLLSRDTMYGRNRIFILLSIILSLVLPLISIETRVPNDLQVFGREMPGITVDGSGTTKEPGSNWLPLSWIQIVLVIYSAGVVLAGIRLLIEIVSLLYLMLVKGSDKKKIVQLTNSKTSGFSAFGHIFIDSSLEPDEAEEIIRHEQKHLNQLHFIDILLIEGLKVIQWFNPFIYLFDRSLRAVHEYQADEECLSSGIPVHSYQGLVMNQVFRSRIFNASSSFSNPTLLKKRMIMMTKRRSRALSNLKILLVVPVLAVLLVFFSTCTEKITYNDTVIEEVTPPSTAPVTKSGEPEPFVVVEEMPMFPGGDSALLAFIGTNTKYPETAKAKGIQGRVIVRFCVTEKGGIDLISVLKGVDPDLDNEAKRVVSMLPQFKPGRQGGKEVPVWYMVPITFSLSGAKGDLMDPPPPPPPPPSGEKALVIEMGGNENGEKVTANPVVVEGETSGGSEPFVMVEEMPVFPGGDTEMLTFIAQNVKYPPDAKEKNISGRVIARFCVTEKGFVERATIIKSVYPSIDAEALRVIRMLPQFQPGRQGGKPVAVWYMVPVTFSLK